GGDEALEDARRRGGAEPGRADDVFHRDGDAGERAGILARGDAPIERLGGGDGARVVDREEGAEARVDLGDAREARARELDGGELAAADARRGLAKREIVLHSMIFGTRKCRP